MYDDSSTRGDRLLTPRTLGLALAVHLALVAVVWGVGVWLHRAPEVVIPIDLTIVPPWAEQRPDDPEPDPRPPPPPAPPPKPVARVKAPEAPKLPETQDAVIREKPKPKKPKVEKGDFKKNAKLVKRSPKKPEPVDFKKNAKLVKAPPTVSTGKATAHDKPLSPADFQRLMNQGYKVGARNQLAANEESRCAGLVAQAIKRRWTDEFHWREGLQSVYLELVFGPGGALRRYRIVRSSGDAQVDASVLSAARATGSVPGLTPAFVQKYSATPFVLEMKPVRQ